MQENLVPFAFFLHNKPVCKKTKRLRKKDLNFSNLPTVAIPYLQGEIKLYLLLSTFACTRTPPQNNFKRFFSEVSIVYFHIMDIFISILKT